MKSKVCNTCNIKKDVTEFKSMNQCKSCRREYEREYYQKNKDKIVESKIKYYYNNIDKVKEYRDNNIDKVKEYYYNNIDKVKENKKEYYRNNIDNIKQYRKEYYYNNIDKVKEYKKEYYYNNVDKVKEKSKERYRNNMSSIKEKTKEYYQKNIDKIKEKRKVYRDNNKESIKIFQKEYRENNKDKLKEYRDNNKDKRRSYDNYKRLTDPILKLKQNISRNMRRTLSTNGYIKKSRTYKILGCTYDEFRFYIESQWEEWMNWDNYGKYNGEERYGWDLDHIIPMSYGKCEEDIIRLNHHSNIQPLCSYINRYVKRDKIEKGLSNVFDIVE